MPTRIGDAIVNTGSWAATYCPSAEPGPPTYASLDTFGIIKDSSLTDNTDDVDFTDEGDRVWTRSGQRKAEWTCNIMQTTAQDIKLMVHTLSGTYCIFKKLNVASQKVNNKDQWLVIPLARVKKTLTFAKQGSELPYQFAIDINEADYLVKLDTAGMDDGNFDVAVTALATLTIPAGEGWGIYEQ